MDTDDGKSPNRKKQCRDSSDAGEESSEDAAAQPGQSSTEIDYEIGREDAKDEMDEGTVQAQPSAAGASAASSTAAAGSDETNRHIPAIPAKVADVKAKSRAFLSRQTTCFKQNCLGCAQLTSAPENTGQNDNPVHRQSTVSINALPPFHQIFQSNMPHPPPPSRDEYAPHRPPQHVALAIRSMDDVRRL
jgi:hypothetical protein